MVMSNYLIFNNSFGLYHSFPLQQNVCLTSSYFFKKIDNFMQNVTVNLFFTISVRLLICHIHCDLYTLPTASLNKFMETVSKGFFHVCTSVETAAHLVLKQHVPQARSSLYHLISHQYPIALETAKGTHVQCRFSGSYSQRF